MKPTIHLLIAAHETQPEADASALLVDALQRVEPMGIGDYVNYIIALVILVGVIVAIRFIVESQRQYPLKAKADLERGQRQAIQSAVKADDFFGAADLAFEYEAFEDAADLFIKAGDFLRAAESFELCGKRPDAITYYKRAAKPEKAAELFEKAGQFRYAAKEYKSAGKAEKAAELYMEARDFRAAAESYQDLQDWQRAGEAYERLGLKDDMSEMYLRFFEEQFNLVRGNLNDIPKARKAARQVAIHYHEQGRPMDAAEILARAGFLNEAAKLMARIGDIAAAARLFVESGNPLDAARLYEAAGDEDKAAYFRGEAALMDRDLDLAASEFARAGELHRAAELYAEAHNSARAAELYEQLGDYRTAAEFYSLSDNLQRAARCYEEGGEYQRAAEVFHEIGDIESEIRVLAVAGRFFSLGELLLELNRPDDALAAFQKVDNIDLRYPEACEIQGDILCERKQYEVASLKYRQALHNTEPNSGNLKIYYKMARSLEALGDDEKLAEALKIYDGIVAVDYYFQDVKSRRDALQADLYGSQMRANERSMRSSRFSSGRSRSGRDSAAMAYNTGEMPPPATAVSRYEILSEIARGGMGVVYKATDTVLNRTVAFKILSENLKGNPTAVKYFLREARAAAALTHPNIVTVFDAGEQGGEYYMAMEYVEGETLKTLVQRNGAFHEKLLRFIVDRCCRGLGYAHEQGIVHRDIKSGNIMLTRDKSLKIMDFGLAKFIEEYRSQHTQAIGTPFYMSPEQILGRDLDYRSDLYSLGVTLFECATGTVPFTKGELSYHHLHTQPPRPRDLNPKLSEKMEDMILQLLQKNPDDRYHAASDILKDLKRA